jgi:hypothetical protein
VLLNDEKVLPRGGPGMIFFRLHALGLGFFGLEKFTK